MAPRRPRTRYQEEEGRRGRKGTNGCSRPPPKGSAHLGPGRQERGPERQVSQKFPGLRSHGGRHLIQETSKGILTGCRQGGRGLEEEGRGKGRGRPPPAASHAPSARARLVTLGRGHTPEGVPCRSPASPTTTATSAPNSFSVFGASSSRYRGSQCERKPTQSPAVVDLKCPGARDQCLLLVPGSECSEERPVWDAM